MPESKAQPQHRPELGELEPAARFCEDIRGVLIPWDMCDGDLPPLDLIAPPVIGAVYVFHSGLVLQMLCDLKGGLVVNEKGRWTGYVVTKLLEKVPHPDNLAANFRSSGIFRFSTGQGYMRLEAAPPLGSAAPDTDCEASSRSTVVRVTALLCV